MLFGEQDDYIEQDLTVDPYLPLADGYFDIVVMPAMFQVTRHLSLLSL